MCAKDTRRKFTSAQRRALFWVANGRCSNCGITLDPHNWHADHVKPHSLYGRTDVINGQALCPTCNLKKGYQEVNSAPLVLNPWPAHIVLRSWQKRFLETWLRLCNPEAGGQKDFLMAVTPAGGKTTAALIAAHKGFSNGWFKKVIVIVPTTHLVKQWIDAADEKGISLMKYEDYGTGIVQTPDFLGVVATYQTVARNPEKFRKFSSVVDTFVIADELHHCGEQEHPAWADAMRKAFDHSMSIRLVCTGTPFRSDNNKIPFVTYLEELVTHENGRQEYQYVSRADFEYSYGEALRDANVVRDIIFPTWDGTLTWKRGDQRYTHTFQDDLDDQRSSDRLRTALDTNGDWLPAVIKNANDRLVEIRNTEGHENAGGLIICKDKIHAEKIARQVRIITGTEPAIAHSDVPEASSIIDNYKSSNSLWIIAVRMVSEGVDIKRLRIGIYATNYKTKLFFFQAIARVTRFDSTVSGIARDGQPVGQTAWFYVPEDPELVAYMAEIKQICMHYISEGLIVDNEGLVVENSSNEPNVLISKYDFIDAVDPLETGHFYDDRKWSHEDMRRALLLFKGMSAFDHVPEAAKAQFIDRLFSQTNPPDRKPEEQTITPVTKGDAIKPRTQTLQDERETLRKACNSMTYKLAALLITNGTPPKDSRGRLIWEKQNAVKIITYKLNQHYAVQSIKDMSIDNLKNRRTLLAELIHDVVNGQWDETRFS